MGHFKEGQPELLTTLACKGQILTRHVAENAAAQLCVVQRLEGPISTGSWWPWGAPRAHQVLL